MLAFNFFFRVQMLEDEVQPIKIEDPSLRRLVANIQRIR
jgi:hypothetical protein